MFLWTKWQQDSSGGRFSQNMSHRPSFWCFHWGNTCIFPHVRICYQNKVCFHSQHKILSRLTAEQATRCDRTSSHILGVYKAKQLQRCEHVSNFIFYCKFNMMGKKTSHKGENSPCTCVCLLNPCFISHYISKPWSQSSNTGFEVFASGYWCFEVKN